MILLAPVNSVESAKMQIEAGANEIYIGLKSNMYKRYSFSGRGQNSQDYDNLVANNDELKKIVDIAHKNNVEVSLAANISMFSDYCGEEYEKEYINLIIEGVDKGVDNLIIGDIGLLIKVASMDLDVNIHASTYFDTMSIEQLKFLKKLGVSRAVLTYQSHIEEIKRLCEADIMEIEVFGYLSCSFYNGGCNLIHDMGEVAENEAVLLGVPCKSEYLIEGVEGDKKIYPFFDAELPCGLCQVKQLMDIGVDVIKIAGRDRKAETISKVTAKFRQAIDYADSGKSLKELRNTLEPWWVRMYCRKNRCKYKDNSVVQSYIGLN